MCAECKAAIRAYNQERRAADPEELIKRRAYDRAKTRLIYLHLEDFKRLVRKELAKERERVEGASGAS